MVASKIQTVSGRSSVNTKALPVFTFSLPLFTNKDVTTPKKDLPRLGFIFKAFQTGRRWTKRVKKRKQLSEALSRRRMDLGRPFCHLTSASFSGQFARVKAKAQSEFKRQILPGPFWKQPLPASSYRPLHSAAPPPREKTQFNSFVIIRAIYQRWCQVLCPTTTGHCTHALDKPEKNLRNPGVVERACILERDQQDFKSQQWQNSCVKSREQFF